MLGKFRMVGNFFDAKFGGGINERIMFVHIPKCGGSSAGTAIKKAFGPWANLQQEGLKWINAVASQRASKLIGKPFHQLRRNLLIYYLSQDTNRFVTGHVTVNTQVMEAFRNDWHFLTVLRDPVERWYSEYYYNKMNGTDYSKIELDLEEYISSKRGVSSGWTYVHYFSGERTKAEQNIAEAKTNLSKFSLIGLLDNMPAFESRFNSLFDADISIPHYNKTPVPRHKRENIQPSTHQKVVDLCQADIEIYNWVKENAEQIS